MEALLTKDDPDKIKLLSQLIEKYTRVKEFLSKDNGLPYPPKA